MDLAESLVKFFFDSDEQSSDKGKKSITKDVSFVTPTESRAYSQSITGQLLNQDSALNFISKHLPENGRNLREQAEGIKQLLSLCNDEHDPDVVKAFGEYMKLFNADYRLAEGLAALEDLKAINSHLSYLFTSSIQESKLSNEKIIEQHNAILALQKNVDEADSTDSPILPIDSPNRQFFNHYSAEAEYRLKMLELLYDISQNEWDSITSDRFVNPFVEMNDFQRKNFPTFFQADLTQAAKDYKSLSYREELINKYSRHKFNQIDEYARQLNIKIGTQELRDATFGKMFTGELSPEELFLNIKKLVYLRYKLNEMGAYIPKALEQQEQEEQKQEEERMAKEQEEAKIRELQRKAEEEQEGLAVLSDEDIQARIDELYHDVTQTGSRFVNILDYQKRVAKAKGLIPTDEMIQSKDLVFNVYTSNGLLSFLELANASGTNYIVFPDSQEGANGGFNVLVSASDKGILAIPNIETSFGPSSVKYVNGNSVEKWKSHGTAPSYFIYKIDELYKKSNNVHKDTYKNHIYVDKIEDDLFEIGVLSKLGGTSPNTDKFLSGLIREAYEEVGQTMKKSSDVKDVLSYVSIPAKYNIIPLLRKFKEKGVSPLFERVPLESARNTKERDNIHIYFYRDDYDIFKDEIMPILTSGPASQRIPFKVHYGKDFDFRDETLPSSSLIDLDDKKHKRDRDD